MDPPPPAPIPHQGLVPAATSSPTAQPNPAGAGRPPRPHKEQAHSCPRCNSTNTKFCYYNNYSFSQPRYFCRACKRYWTHGGSLRNVPVGGASRRGRRQLPPAPPADPMQSPVPYPGFYESLGGLLHGAGSVWGPFVPPAYDGGLLQPGGGDCCGFWINGVMIGGGSCDGGGGSSGGSGGGQS